MQGSNHLEEADRRPLNLCPICLRKLQCAIGFKIVERYKVNGCVCVCGGVVKKKKKRGSGYT